MFWHVDCRRTRCYHLRLTVAATAVTIITSMNIRFSFSCVGIVVFIMIVPNITVYGCYTLALVMAVSITSANNCTVTLTITVTFFFFYGYR